MMRLFIITHILSLFVYVAHAQMNASLLISPEEREPYSLVTLTLSSAAFDTNTATIGWTIDGVDTGSALGKREISVRLKGIGEKTVVKVTATNKKGGTFTQETTLTPSSLVLLHEAPKSHVPTFYEGRSFGTEGSPVTVTAFPVIEEGGVIVPYSLLSYAWYLNDTSLPKSSGVGRQSASFALDYLREETKVKVIVRSESGKRATKTITLKPFDIEPRLYAYNELLGTLLQKPFGQRIEATEVFSVALEPYFLTTKGRGAPKYTWLLDGIDVTPSTQNVLGLIPKPNAFGIQNLLIRVEGSNKNLEQKSVSTEILFDSR